VLEGGNQPGELAAIIREDAVFHSPVVHTPQRGRDIVVAYLAAAGVVLEFENEVEGIKINGVDIITFSDDGRLITHFKVMVRPLKAINKVWELMGAQLQRMDERRGG
jgi:hypothetical protein